MKRYEEAIVWPANPNIAGPDMPLEEADVEENQKFLKSNGAVYWDSAAKRKELEGPFEGYIYIAQPVGKVLYGCKVEWVISRERLKQRVGEDRFIPPFRKQCFKGRFPNGKKHNPSPTWIKISKIGKLSKPKKIEELKKLDGTPVRRIQGGFVYIKCP